MPDLDPIPYYASLAKVLHGPTLALVLTYLEIHHPAPQDSSESHSNLTDAPIMIDCDVASAALGVSRRTLHIAFNCLGACWSNESERSRAARAGREFLNPAHSLKPTGHDPVKIYSFIGSRAYQTHRILAMRRNHSKLCSVLLCAGLTPDHPQLTEYIEVSRPSCSVRTLSAMLPNWGDRRAERWDRWRRETGKKSVNPGRMRDSKKSVTSLDCAVSIDSAVGCGC